MENLTAIQKWHFWPETADSNILLQYSFCDDEVVWLFAQFLLLQIVAPEE